MWVVNWNITSNCRLLWTRWRMLEFYEEKFLRKIWGFSKGWLWRMPSPGMWRHVDLVWTDVSEERIASIFRVEKTASEELAWEGAAVCSHAKVKLSLCLTNQTIRHEGVWGSGCIEPHILDLCTSWRWVTIMGHHGRQQREILTVINSW
jgi:hypothetical protein